MVMTKEQIRSAFIEDALASAIEAFDKRFSEIEGQVRQGLDDNDVKKVRIKVDKDQNKISTKGGVGATVTNITEWCDGPEREIDNPDQGKLFDNTEGQDAEEVDV